MKSKRIPTQFVKRYAGAPTNSVLLEFSTAHFFSFIDWSAIADILKSVSRLEISTSEMKEQEDAAAGGAATDTGSAKTTGAKQWESGRKMGKTYGGSKYVWKSDRTMYCSISIYICE